MKYSKRKISVYRFLKYLIGYLDKVIKPLVLILTKMSEYVKTVKGKNN